MYDAATWSGAPASPAVKKGWSTIARALAESLLILAVTLSLCAAIYVNEKTVLRLDASGKAVAEPTAEWFRRTDTTAGQVAALMVVGGLGALIPLARTARRSKTGSKEEDQVRQAREWRSKAVALQSQLIELQRKHTGALANRSQLEQQIQTLAHTTARLQEDLEKRNRAENLLSQKRLELESRKSVLEMHVQARQAELQTLQRRYEMILNAAGEGICGLDTEGKATFVNPTMAKLTGRPAGELIGKTEREIFFPGAADKSPALATQQSGEMIFQRTDNSCFPVEFVKTPINEDGQVVGSVLVFKDITERKRSEEDLARKADELARSNAELEQFAFVASHDLQEPLRKIQAFGDRLKDKCHSSQSTEAISYLERMQGAAARMRTLINDLLTFSRVIRSSAPLVAVDLNQVTKEVLSDLEVRIEKSGAVVEVGPLPTFDADPMQMRQLMLNLLSNALKFQPPGGTPRVTVQSRTFSSPAGQPMCEFSVQDNGIGFDEKYLDKMFAVFQRLHGRSEYEGTGIGLAVCRRITDRHHGTIAGRSKPGEGATFIVTLPAHQSGAQAAT